MVFVLVQRKLEKELKRTKKKKHQIQGKISIVYILYSLTHNIIYSTFETPHVPQCIPYHMEDVLVDLVVFAARTLLLGGRLVYWLPTTDE